MTEEIKRKIEEMQRMTEDKERKMIAGREGLNTEETANKRNTISIKKVAMKLATNQNHPNIATTNKKITSEDNKERRRTTRANTRHLNRNTVTIDPKKRAISLYLCVRRAIERSR